MKSIFVPSVAMLMVLFSSSVSAVDDAPAPNPSEVMEILQNLQLQRDQVVGTGLQSVLNKVSSAASSPSAAIDFYLEAVRATKFDGLTKEQASFRDWKEKNEQKLDDSDYRTGLMLHLHYLGLTIRRASGVEVADLLPEILKYTAALKEELDRPLTNKRVVAAPKRKQRQQANTARFAGEWLRKSVTSGEFAQRYSLGFWLKGIKGWEMTPGNYDGIYNQMILPLYRENKDIAAIGYWDEKIQRAQQKAVATHLSLPLKKFEEVDLPLLLWQRAGEYDKLGYPNKALVEMVGVAKKFPAHPAFDSWVKKIKAVLTKPQEPAADVPVTGAPAGTMVPAS